MNYVDLILKYLSGELSPDEVKSFQKDLASNAELQKEYEEVSAAFELIRDQLQLRDELSFRKKLLEAMDHVPPPSDLPARRIRPWWYVLLAVAATLAILLVISLDAPGNERLWSRYYKPETDPVLLAYHQDTRGERDAAIVQFQSGNYREAMRMLGPLVSKAPENKGLLLYYLLSAMELDRQGEVIDTLLAVPLELTHLADQALSWYGTLALIKSDRRQEAIKMLDALLEEPGPYQSRAEKLLKLLLK
jgi:tetratricopeptide (TPR) repeat protein